MASWSFSDNPILPGQLLTVSVQGVPTPAPVILAAFGLQDLCVMVFGKGTFRGGI